ncbi:hypothetical protein RRG08_043551 [Elysia crispata]|uniref:Uncharacterized protein n=1 Tax=Elysia crispata TaxID=231223 RepID=A0AAE1CYF3_9GAST|nr:hypothetical protein RRG08_043551 [Elysia crispata]
MLNIFLLNLNHVFAPGSCSLTSHLGLRPQSSALLLSLQRRRRGSASLNMAYGFVYRVITGEMIRPGHHFYFPDEEKRPSKELFSREPGMRGSCTTKLWFSCAFSSKH